MFIFRVYLFLKLKQLAYMYLSMYANISYI